MKKALNTLLARYLIPYLAIILISVLVFAWFVNGVLLGHLREQYRANTTQTVYQYSLIIDGQLKQLRTIYEYLIQNQTLRPNLNLDDVVSAQDTIRTLGQYTVSNAFIDESYLYLHGDNYIYSSSTTYPLASFLTRINDGRDYTRDRLIEAMTSIDNGEIISSYEETHPLSNIPSANRLAIFYRLQTRAGQATLVFVINPTESITVEPAANFILADTQQGVLAIVGSNQLEAVENNAINEELQALVSLEGVSFHQEIELPLTGEEYLLINHVSDDTSLHYIYFTPSEVVFNDISMLRMNFLIILLVLVLISMIIIHYSLRMNYRPMSELIGLVREITKRDSKDTEVSHLREVSHTLTTLVVENESLRRSETVISRDRFYTDLLLGRISDHEEITTLTVRLAPEIDDYPYVAVLIIKVHQSGIVDREDLAKTLNQLLFGKLLPMNEYNTFVHVALLKEGTAPEHSIVSELHATLRSQCNSNVLITVSKIKECPDGLAEAYSEANQAMDYEFYYGSDGVISYSDLTFDEGWGDDDSNRLMQSLIAQLKLGNEEEAIAVLDEIMKYFRSSPTSLYYVKGFSFQLIQNMSHLITELSSYQSHDINLVSDPSEFETMNDLFVYLKELATEICARQKKSEEDREEEKVEMIKAYVQNGSMESTFSVQEVAEQFSMSMPALSTYFKNQTGITISTYIAEVRMKRAKDLLLNTELTINEIVPLVGYVNASSFIRKFKSIYGLTPGQYIKANKKG